MSTATRSLRSKILYRCGSALMMAGYLTIAFVSLPAKATPDTTGAFVAGACMILVLSYLQDFILGEPK